MEQKMLNKKFYQVMMSLFLGLISIMTLATVTAVAASEEGNTLMGEGNEQKIMDSSVPKARRVFNFTGLFSNNDTHIVPAAKNFSDYNLYDEETMKSVKKELGISGNIVAVPRNRAIQQGETLEGSHSSGPLSNQWSIEGEYGFVPTFSPRTEVTVYKEKSNGSYEKIEIYKNTGAAETEKVNDMGKYMVKKGEHAYVKFTDLGFYKGEPISVVMDTTILTNQVSIGLTRPGKDVDSAASFMSVSGSGIGNLDSEEITKDNHYGANYVEVSYKFYNSKKDKSWKDKLADNKEAEMKVRGFFTYADFDFEESIGFNKDINISNLYVLQGGQKGDSKPMESYLSDPFNPDKFLENYYSKKDTSGNKKVDQALVKQHAKDPLGLREGDLHAEKINPFHKYLSQYYFEDSDWISQLSFTTTDDGYRYFNRGSRSNVNEYRISNWLSFTYEETKSFDLRINVSAMENFSINGNKVTGKILNFDEKYDLTAGHIFRPTSGNNYITFQNENMFYKIIEKKLDEKGFTGTTNRDEIKEIFEFYDVRSREAPTINSSKVTIGYGTRYDFPIKEAGIKDDEQKIKSYLTDYYTEVYLKYKLQQVETSRQEKMLEFLYTKLTTVDKSIDANAKYSPYGFNKENISNFYLNDKMSGTIQKEIAAKASTQSANISAYFFSSSIFDKNIRDYPAENGDIAGSFNLLRRRRNTTDTSATSRMNQDVTPRGSNVYFTSDTLLPISFPAPLKVTTKDDTDAEAGKIENIVEWEIIQSVPPRVLNNSEPQYDIVDEINPLLKVKKEDVSITDMTSGNDETRKWNITVQNNTLKVSAPRELLNEASFNNRHFKVSIKATVNKEYAETIPKEEFEKIISESDPSKKGMIKVPNVGKVLMAAREEEVGKPNHEMFTRPTYDDKEGVPTNANIKLFGNVNIEKVAEEDNNKRLKDAVFEVRDTDKKTVLATGETDENGRLKLSNIPVGKVWLYETKAPTGYRPIQEKEITVFPYDHQENQYKIADTRSMLVGEFDKVEKSVKNQDRENIDGQLVAYDEILTYEITANIKDSNKPTEVAKIVLNDTLDKGLELVPNTTFIKKNAEAATNIPDTQVWKTTPDGQFVLNTESIQNLALIENETLTFMFNVKVRKTAGLEVKNKATLTGFGFDDKNEEQTPTKTTNEVKNHLSDPIWIRQVVVNKNGNLAIPKDTTKENRGYVKASNIDSQNETSIYSTVNITAPSNEFDKLRSYKKVNLSPKLANPNYRFEPIVPEMYNYKGYVLSDTDNTIDLNQLKTGLATIDLSKKNGRYLTVVLEPKETKIPLFYNWDYVLNDFNQINAKSKPIRIKFYKKQDGSDSHDVPAKLEDLKTFGDGVLLKEFTNLDSYYYKMPYIDKDKKLNQGTVLEDVTLKNTLNVNLLPKEIPINLYFTDKDGKEEESLAKSGDNGIQAKTAIEYLVGFSNYRTTQRAIDTQTNPNEIIVWYSIEYIPIIADF
ncbi:SpaA isopeptide-forming pilin-related protein [Vagococcus carniphilus]|uniref:SpaA isopeptide-forming pilin-related protein n=1 Tax=Vagococcus carniphilus TaxID=218144 RepID=A0AAW8TYX8_9ENTE|nr:SpaA isopeptide-forming pilin-related protein [Vagococcus carniphilus]MDT2832518.1 SpaA isopeptide-forming pilin-related protein [Vagococcus carniphilus]